MSRIIILVIQPKNQLPIKIDEHPKLAWTFSGSIAWERTRDKLYTIVLGKTYLHKSCYVYGYPELEPLPLMKENNFFEYLADYVVEGNLVTTSMNDKVLDQENITALSHALFNAIEN